MDRDEALELLKGGPDGVAEWNRRRKMKRDKDVPSLIEANLGGASLPGADLRGVALSGADLAQAFLCGADFTAASLCGVRFSGAVLRGALLVGADLIDANLAGADLCEADVTRALMGRTVIASNLRYVAGLEEVEHIGPSFISVDSMLTFGDDLPENFLRGCGLRNEEIEYFRSVIGSPIRFYSCFISYSHANKSFARRLHDALQGVGIRCWRDEHELLPGDDMHDHVNRAIRLWDKVILCCSKDSLTSWWVDNEMAAAFQKEQQLMKQRSEKVLALIPLDLDGYVFSGWQGAKKDTVLQRLVGDFKAWDTDNAKFEREFQKLVKALRADDGARQKPPP